MIHIFGSCGLDPSGFPLAMGSLLIRVPMICPNLGSTFNLYLSIPTRVMECRMRTRLVRPWPCQKKMEPPYYLGQYLRLRRLYDALASIFRLEMPKYGQI